MPRLTDTQLVILSAACQRDDCSVYPITARVTGGALDRVLNSLLAKNLIEEVPAGRAQTVWRTDDAGSRFTLRATDAACDALGIAERPAAGPETESRTRKERGSKPAAVRKGSRAAKGKGKAATAKAAKRAPAKAKRAPGTRTGTKQEKLIAMLRRKQGATVEEIVKALDWQPHTVRGAIAGALKKKLGLNVSSEKVEGRGRVYRIAD
jgi:hypothetical protein